MKKILTVIFAAMIITMGTATSFALDPIVSPSAPLYTDTDLGSDTDRNPNAPKTGNTAVETAAVMAACGALALTGVALNKKLGK